MIKPTVGRKVWYRPSHAEITADMKEANPHEPLDATIVGVHGDRCVNLVVFDFEGHQHRRLSVTFVQPGDPSDTLGVDQPYAEWMPYQVSQAKAVETKTYADGTTVAGFAPLPDASPTSGHVELDNIGSDKSDW
jgi:hypothetical protein